MSEIIADKEKKISKEKVHTKTIFNYIIGPLLFGIIMLLPIPGLSFEGKTVLATLLWMVAWWIASPFPAGAISLLPIVILPLTNALPGPVTAKAYGDPLNFLFLGGFAIALALEKWNLHERISINIIGAFSGSTSGMVTGMLISSFFISMWVSNTATAMMLLPIGTAMAAKVVTLMKQEEGYTEKDGKNFTTSIVLGIAIGATIGGSSTLIGTPPNLILAGLASQLYGIEIPFGKWMLFALPLTAILLAVTIFVMTKFVFPVKIKKLQNGQSFIKEEKFRIGKMTYEEKVVTGIFVLTIFLWLTRTFIWIKFVPGMSDTMIAIFAGILIFAWPASKKHGGKILNADAFGKMPWSVLLMIGGGLAIAEGFQQTDLAQWIGNQLLALQGASYFAILIACCALALVMTQVAPNTATTTILVPIASSLAVAVGVDPIPVMVITALGAGFAYMLPIGTPTFGVVYASGKIEMNDMIKMGGIIVLAAFFLLIGFVYYIYPIIF